MKTFKIHSLVLTVLTLLFFMGTDVQAQIKVVNNKVGVNKTSPVYNLDIGGTVRATEFRDGTYVTLRTGSGYTNIGPGNAYWSHFLTDRPAFWFQKRVEVNGHFSAYGNNTHYCGTNSKRWKRGYFTSVYRVNEQTLSDKNAKENFRSIDDALGKVLRLNGVLYDYKPEIFMPETYEEQPIDDTEPSTTGTENTGVLDTGSEDVDMKKLRTEAETARKNHIGFIAQDVKEIIPEAVEYDDEADLYSMSYTALIPVLVEAIKEQQQQIDALKEELDAKR